MKHHGIRFLLYLAGLYLTALGIVITTQSSLGVAAVTCLATSISMLVQVSLGTVLAFLYCGFVGIEYLILRKEFRAKNFLQMFFAFIFGFFTDSIGLFLILHPTTFLEQFLLLWVGLAVCALGVVLTIQMDIVPCAPDGLVNVIAQKQGKTFGKVKVRFDSLCVGIALTISFIFLHSFGGFGITTFISALCLGRMMGFFEKLLQRQLRSLAFAQPL